MTVKKNVLFATLMHSEDILSDDEENLIQELIRDHPDIPHMQCLLTMEPYPTFPIEYYEYHWRRCLQKQIPFPIEKIVTDKRLPDAVLMRLMIYMPEQIGAAFIKENVWPGINVTELLSFHVLKKVPGYVEWVQKNRMFVHPFYMDILTFIQSNELFNKRLNITYLEGCNNTFGWTTERTDWFLAIILHNPQNTTMSEKLTYLNQYKHSIPTVNDIYFTKDNIVEEFIRLKAPNALKVYQLLVNEKNLGISYTWSDVVSDMSNVIDEEVVYF